MAIEQTIGDSGEFARFQEFLQGDTGKKIAETLGMEGKPTIGKILQTARENWEKLFPQLDIEPPVSNIDLVDLLEQRFGIIPDVEKKLDETEATKVTRRKKTWEVEVTDPEVLRAINQKLE